MIQLLDYRRHPSLLRKSGKEISTDEFSEVTSSPEFLAKLEAMKEILISDGVGLAAPQVNWSIRLFMLCIDENGADAEPQVFINPEILEYSKTEEKFEEGCLSLPGLYMKIRRPLTITWKYRTLAGDEILKESSGLYARVIQHETDHCYGKVFIDKASTAQKAKIKKWLRS